MRIHNDVYFNPYKILEIDRVYTPELLKKKYKEAALKNHPDKGGDIELFKEITQSYIYLLKKYKENLPDKQIYELKEEFNDFTKDQPNLSNIFMNNSQFDLNNFNNVFNDNFKANSKGYGDFLKNDVINETKTESNSYIFSDTFNLNVFNKIFNTTSKKMKQNSVIVYKEPETVFQSNNGYSELDEDDELEDYTSGFSFNKKMHFTDCKKAYSQPEDLSSINLDSFNSIDELEKHRDKISYNMSPEDLEKYNNYIESYKLKEAQKQKKIERNDINIIRKYKQFNQTMLQNN